MEQDEIVKVLSRHDKDIALNKQKLESIESQVTNHIPTAITGLHTRIDDFQDKMDKRFDKWDGRMWKIYTAIGTLIGSGAYGIVEAVK